MVTTQRATRRGTGKGAAVADTRATLGALIRWLAARCDGAANIDGAGFAKNDVKIGHELARTPEGEWNEEMAWWAYTRVQKHRGQIDGAHGPGTVAAIPAPPEVAAGTEPWWRRARREAAEAAAAARPRRPTWEERKAQRDAEWDERRRLRDAAEAAKPKVVRLKGRTPAGAVEVRFDYGFSYATNDLIKTIPGARFCDEVDAQFHPDKHWAAPVTLASAKGIAGLVKDGFTLTPAVTDALADLLDAAGRARQLARANEVASAATDAALTIPGLARQPYPFQLAGIAYAAREKRVLLADEPGLGKTLQAIGTVQLTGTYPAVVVCPASVKYNWRREWEATVPGKRVVVVPGKRALALPQYREADVLIVAYDSLGGHLLAFQTETRPGAVIIDESHYIKNARAARTKACTALLAGVGVRLCLSGTPVLNRPVELLPQLEALDRLADVAADPRGKAAPRWYFLSHYCAASQNRWGDWDFDGAAHLDELHRRLRQTCFVRRRKAEVLKELPPKTRTVIEVDLSNRAEYDRMERNLVAELAREALADRAFLATLAGLTAEERRAKERERWHSETEKVRRAEQLIRFTALKQVAARGKLDAIKEWAGDFLASGEKLVMFGWHREVVTMLADTFAAPTVMGGDTAERRQRSVDAFQTDPAVRAIACNIIAAGEGITLTAARTSLFAELGWNAGKMTQAEDRIHRIGQEADAVNIYYILGKDTIDMEVWEIIESKRAVVDQLTDGVAPAGDQDEPVMQALIGRLLAKAGVAPAATTTRRRR